MGSSVWEHVWRHHPSDVKDDTGLARERETERWHQIQRRLIDRFHTLVGLKTVELGCGRGDLSVLLAERGADVTLFDMNQTALDQARHRFRRLGLAATYRLGDMLALDRSDSGRFDVALSSGVIEHFEREMRTRVIEAHRDAVKPSGMVIISVPNAWCVPYRVWKYYLELRGWWPYGLEIPYTKRELRRRAREVELKAVEVAPVGLWQSLSAHWARGLLRLSVDWSYRRSWLDALQGANLLLFGTRQEARSRSIHG
ncbi:MAG: methyltransferase domain-containing protein [Phycisphaerae bacterium]